jgi:3',5'-cyclic AMP phosphodiesterase CpdA
MAAGLLVCLSCGGTPQTPTGPTSPTAQDSGVHAAPVTPVATNLPTEIFAGAGDIAQCDSENGSEMTARLLEGMGGTVFALGDNAYPSGRAEDYRNCYDPTWGRLRNRTRPAPGNHEYDTGAAAPYFDYFGANAGPAGLGYYSFELGNWHVVSLNSNIAAGGGSAQAAWLRADLAASTKACTLAYWHHPLFSSSRHGNQEHMRDIWQILYEAGVEIVLGGHDHVYERFAPQDMDGGADPSRGIREFVVGTGGATPYPFVDVKPNSEVRLSSRGVLRLALAAGRYDWTFVSLSGPGDAGQDTCH